MSKLIKISDFGDRLKEYRINNMITLYDLENIVKVPAQTLNRYELKQRFPKLDVALLIADKLNISPLWLMGYDVSINDIYEKTHSNEVQEKFNKQEQHLLDLYHKLNGEGQELVIGYADTLVQSGKYKKPSEYEVVRRKEQA